MSFNLILRDIKSLKIQGANAVALKSLQALDEVVHKSKDLKQLKADSKRAIRLLSLARSTEPCLRNALNYVILNAKGSSYREYKESFHEMISKASMIVRSSKKAIAEYGSNKIKDRMTVFTHCHSSTVVDILLEAKKEKKRFTVHNTETRPRFQGRITAKELAKAGIPVVHFVDSAARLALKRSDIMLIGCDAITAEGSIINKIGSELFAEVAYRYDIPIYSCTSSWKFDPLTVFGFEEKIEKRSPKEVWERPPKGVRIDNHAFEIVKPGLISGIISEIGIYPPKIFAEEMKRRNPWMFKKQNS